MSIDEGMAVPADGASARFSHPAAGPTMAPGIAAEADLNLSPALNPVTGTSDTPDMPEVLPDEFPFNRRAAASEPAPAAAPVLSAPPASGFDINGFPLTSTPATVPEIAEPVRPEAPAPVVVNDEPLIEVRSATAVVYRGRERRRSPRQALRAKAVYRPDPAAPGDAPHPGAVQVSNISMLGVRFWTRAPMPPGARGYVRMEVGPLKWSSRVRVVSCTPCEDDGHVCGCEFIGNELRRQDRSAAA